MGKAIARGETEIRVALSNLGTFTTMERIAKLQADFPMIRFVPASAQDTVKENRRPKQEDFARKPTSGNTASPRDCPSTRP